MTRAEILNAAIDSGLCNKNLSDLESEYLVTDYGFSTNEVLKFAELVALTEREACASVCEQHIANQVRAGMQPNYKRAAINCAKAIRDR